MQDIETLSDSPVTAISAGRQSYSDVFVAGFADGVVKLFDLRLDAEEPVVTDRRGKVKQQILCSYHREVGGPEACGAIFHCRFVIPISMYSGSWKSSGIRAKHNDDRGNVKSKVAADALWKGQGQRRRSKLLTKKRRRMDTQRHYLVIKWRAQVA